MKVSTVVFFSKKEVQDILIEKARQAANVQAGSVMVEFYDGPESLQEQFAEVKLTEVGGRKVSL